jgi:hypothetical protein
MKNYRCNNPGCSFEINSFSEISKLSHHKRTCAINLGRKRKKTAIAIETPVKINEKSVRIYAIPGSDTDTIERRIRELMQTEDFKAGYNKFVSSSTHIDFLCDGNDVEYDREQYLHWQEQLYDRFSNTEALNSRNLDEFVSTCRNSFSHDLKAATENRLYDTIRNMKSCSENEADNLIKFFNETIEHCTCESMRDLKMGAFRSIKKRVLSRTLITPNVQHLTLPWPESWGMDKMRYPMEEIELRVLDPMQIVAEWMINPEISFGTDCFRTATRSDASGTIDCLYDSLWAIETEKVIRVKDPDGIMLTLMFYEDKVTIGGGSAHGFNAAVITSGNFSLSQTNRDISKAMLGYIPSLLNGEEISSHLRSTLEWTKTQADNEVKFFNMKIARKFWEIVLKPIQLSWKHGSRLYHKGEKVTVYPCIPFAKGDEPALKSQIGILQGNCMRSCLNCDFESLQGIAQFDPSIHRYRDPIYLSKISCIAEEAIIQKSKGKVLTDLQKDYINACHANSIYPFRNCYLETYMGEVPPALFADIPSRVNSIFNVPRDLLHTIDSGIVKNCVLYCLLIIDGIGTYNKEYRSLAQTVNGRIRSFVTPPDEPHLHWRKFPSGLSFMLASYSKEKKGRSTGSGGGIRSTHYIVALIQLYFVIADLLPNTALKLRSRLHEAQVSNVSKTMITCIGSVIDLYFDLKRESWNDDEIVGLRKKVKVVTINMSTLWKLKQLVHFGSSEKLLNSHKLHAISHFPLYISLFGPTVYWDTGRTESYHKENTVLPYSLTSKRRKDESAEMFKQIVHKRFTRWSRLFSFVCNKGRVDLTGHENLSRICTNTSDSDEVEFYSSTNQFQRKCIIEGRKLKLSTANEGDDVLQRICDGNLLPRDKMNELIIGDEFVNELLVNNAVYSILLLDALKFTGSERSGTPKGIIYASDRKGMKRNDFIEILEEDVNHIVAKVVAKVISIFEVTVKRESDDETKHLLLVKYLRKLESTKDFKETLKHHISSNHYKSCCELWVWQQTNVGRTKTQPVFVIIDAASIINTAFVIPSPANSPDTWKKHMFFFIPRNFFDRSDWMPLESEDENVNGVCEEATLQVTSTSIGTGVSASITNSDETVMMSLNTIDKYYSSSRGGSSLSSHSSSQPEAASLRLSLSANANHGGSRGGPAVHRSGRDVLSEYDSECESESESICFNHSEVDSDSD